MSRRLGPRLVVWCGLALWATSTGCTTRYVWNWVCDRPSLGAVSAAYVDDTGRRIAFQLDQRAEEWLEFVLVVDWRDSVPGTPIQESFSRSGLPPWWVRTSRNGRTRLPDSIGAPTRSGDAIRVRAGHLFAVCADRREVELIATTQPRDLVAGAAAVCLLPITLVADGLWWALESWSAFTGIILPSDPLGFDD